jgi:hypothetical protein
MKAWLFSVNIENTNIRFISLNSRIFDLWKNKITCKSRAFATDAKARLLHSLLQFDVGLLKMTCKGLLPNTETIVKKLNLTTMAKAGMTVTYHWNRFTKEWENITKFPNI